MPSVRLVLTLTAALSALCLPVSRALAHGELVRSIAEVSAHLEAELGKPVDATRRAKLYLERGELYRLNRDFARAARDYDAAELYDPQLEAISLARAHMLFDSGRSEPARQVLERFSGRAARGTPRRCISSPGPGRPGPRDAGGGAARPGPA